MPADGEIGPDALCLGGSCTRLTDAPSEDRQSLTPVLSDIDALAERLADLEQAVNHLTKIVAREKCCLCSDEEKFNCVGG